MELHDRIKKVAAGLSAHDAAAAYARSVSDPSSLADADKGKAAEFEATVEAMFLMAAVDGLIADEEIAKLAEGIRLMAGGSLIGDDALMAWLRVLQASLEKDGWSARLAEAASKLTTPEARLRAFRFAAGIAMVDDLVAHAEAAAIDAFSKALKIEDEDSSRVLREVQEELFG